MLATLETGVKGGKWFSLMDKVYSPKNLAAAWEKVRRNQGSAGVDGVSIAKFARKEEENLLRLHEELKTGHYEVLPVRRQWIPKPGTTKLRPLGIPAVRDRIVQTALRNVLEPIWEVRFQDRSYGFRPGRSCKDALRQVQHLLDTGYHFVVDADIQSFFDEISREILLSELRREVSDGAVLKLIEKFLGQQVMEDARTWTPVRGTPQGAVISPLLANIYLHPVDVALSDAGLETVRYADDLVVMCRSQQEANRALALLHDLMTQRQLTLHPEKTKIVDATLPGGFDFLGYHFERGYRWPRKKSLDALKERVREITPRTCGNSLETVIAKLNRLLKGWFEYFKHSHYTAFVRIDQWIRMRLRSILRTWNRGKGRGRGLDHQRWPNAFFTEGGLFTLLAAHAAARQSLRR